MIKSFKHKGLKLFFETGAKTGIQAKHAKTLRMQLLLLNVAKSVKELNVPGYKLHPLEGDKKDLWSITVNKNWRLTFEFIDGDVYILNYEDYH